MRDVFLFSIIIPNWNGADFLDRLFHSLKLQIFTDFNIYFVDNGSTDNSLQIAGSPNGSTNLPVGAISPNTSALPAFFLEIAASVKFIS